MFQNTMLAMLLAASSGIAQVAPAQVPIEIAVPDETAPAGGLVQMKVMLTEPKPISGTHNRLLKVAPLLGSPLGVAAFSASGDVCGAALIENGQINLWLISPSGNYGMDPDYPILAIAMPVSADALPGQSTTIGLDPNASVWRDLFGRAYPKTVKSGTFTVGTAPSVINVVPGGGPLPAGYTVRILGTDFSQNTTVQVNEVNVQSVQFVNPGEIDITLRQAADLQGKRIRIQNPDNTQVTYYSYLRGRLVGQSGRVLLTHASPVFPNLYYSSASYATVNPGGSKDLFTGIALQNPNLQKIAVTIALFSAGNQRMGEKSVTLGAGTRILRDLEELIVGVQPGPGSYLKITAPSPVQMLVLAGDDSTDVLRPIPPFSAQ